MTTTHQKPYKSLAEKEDAIIRRIFLVTLTDDGDPRSVYLEMTAATLLSEDKPLLLSTNLMEVALVHRLSAEFPTCAPPAPAAESQFTYLVECYHRAHCLCDELKKIASVKDQTIKMELECVVKNAKKLAVSYCRIHLGCHSDPQVSPLLSLLLRDVSSSSCPPGFIDEVFKEAEYETVEPVLNKLYEDLRQSVIKVSALGNFQEPLRVLMRLVCSFPTCAKALVNHPSWIPKGAHVNGRVIEMTSILGAFFHVSALPDHGIFKSEPDVGQQCFSEASYRATIRKMTNDLYDGLARVLSSLLENIETRESVLEYLAEVINKNSSRAHLQVDPVTSASSGFFLSLSAVMLRLCTPFLDANLTKRNKIDPSYALFSSRLDLRELTTLHALSDEIATWVRQRNEGKQNIEDTFISECFFMTARVLNLGLSKVLSEFKDIVRDLARSKDTLSSLKAMQGQAPSRQLELGIEKLEKIIELCTHEKLCYQAQVLEDVTFLKRAVKLYRLMIVRLADLAGGFKKPLPSSCPILFACFPENFVEDAMELLLVASQVPRALDEFSIDDFINFIVIFMARPDYIRNPHLRAKMVKVLSCWMPKKGRSSSKSMVFEGDALCLDHLVQNLLKLYVEVEMIGASTHLCDKFNIRHDITKLLQYLWNVPGHRHAWIQIAEEDEKGVYLSFLNFLINDITYLLDESLNQIQELKGLEAEMSSTTEWEGRPAQERQRRAQELHSHENRINAHIRLAMEDISMLEFTTEQITAPFLRPEMVEGVANMLNYFMLQLVGPKRSSLSLKDAEKCEFRPKELLKKMVGIYIHLTRGDKENVLPAAICSDGCSYNENLFTAAADILQRIGEDSKVVQEFSTLSAKVKAAASDAMDDEAALGEIPQEFLDPIKYTLMKDPVILPSSNISVDRSVIQRHLLSDTNDPFTRSHLTQDMLRPDIDLKAKIEKFVTSQVQKNAMDVD